MYNLAFLIKCLQIFLFISLYTTFSEFVICEWTRVHTAHLVGSAFWLLEYTFYAQEKIIWAILTPKDLNDIKFTELMSTQKDKMLRKKTFVYLFLWRCLSSLIDFLSRFFLYIVPLTSFIHNVTNVPHVPIMIWENKLNLNYWLN